MFLIRLAASGRRSDGLLNAYRAQARGRSCGHQMISRAIDAGDVVGNPAGFIDLSYDKPATLGRKPVSSMAVVARVRFGQCRTEWRCNITKPAALLSKRVSAPSRREKLDAIVKRSEPGEADCAQGGSQPSGRFDGL